MPVLIKREHTYRVPIGHPSDDDFSSDAYEEKTHWLDVPGQHEDRDATKTMLEEDVESARFAIYEPTGEAEAGLPASYEFSEIVKVTAPPKPSAPTLRKVG